VFLSSSVNDVLGQKLAGRLEIGEKWHWKLYIDVFTLLSLLSRG
jgi:hypothetical protein